jgi:ABC-2 type transport system ATP-binding protein
MTTPVVVVDGCSVAFRGHQVLDQVDLCIEPGTVVGIEGFNGSGKSTLLRVLAGLIAPDHGKVTVLGGDPAARAWPPRIGASIDAPALYGWMSGAGYLRTMLDLSGMPDQGEVEDALVRFGLAEVGRRRILRWSQGMRKRLALAAASLTAPPVLLLDEPTNALDRDGEQLVASWVASHRDAGGVAVLATHRPVDAAMCDRIVALDAGRLVDRG